MVKRNCVFLDRDGVINKAPLVGRYIESWEEFHLIPTIVDWIRIFNALGHLVIVVTNQRCVARGIVSQQRVLEIHSQMTRALAERGAILDDVFVCPHEKESCDCRKPAPGLVLQAVNKWNINLLSSILIGDSLIDQELAESLRMSFIRAFDGRIVNMIDRLKPAGQFEPNRMSDR